MKGHGKKRLFYELMLVAVILAIAAYFTSPKKADGILEVTFIDVGQGDSAFIKTPEGETLLIDGGEEECYEYEILPYLLTQRALKPDFLMASHYHSDHAGGILAMLRIGAAGGLVVPKLDGEDDLKSELFGAAKKNGIEISEVMAGDSVFSNENFKAEVLFPDSSKFENDDNNMNNNSIVLRVEYFDTSFLFTGDLEEEAEKVLINSEMLDADVLKVGHHGSSTSTSKAFFKAVDPEAAVISAGENNSYGHPHKEVMKRLEAADIEIYRTDKNGDITFKADKNGIYEVLTEK